MKKGFTHLNKFSIYKFRNYLKGSKVPTPTGKVDLDDMYDGFGFSFCIKVGRVW